MGYLPNGLSSLNVDSPSLRSRNGAERLQLAVVEAGRLAIGRKTDRVRLNTMQFT